MILLEYQNTKTFLQKITLQIDLKKFLRLKKLKILCRGHMLLMILTEKLEHCWNIGKYWKIVGTFFEKELQKQIKNNLELKK